MIKKIKVLSDTTASKILFFDEIDLTELPNRKIVPLYGANGSGKTTFLKEIKNFLFEMIEAKRPKVDDDNFAERFARARRRQQAKVDHDAQIQMEMDDAPTRYFEYRNRDDNFAYAEPRSYLESFDPTYLSLKYDARSLSEGQSLVYSVEDLLKGMLRTTKRRESFVEDDEHTIVLLDEIDSGLSLDNLDKMMRIIKQVLRQGRDIQFVMSFNNPFVLNYFPDVISMYDGKVHRFENTEEMLEDLKANQKMLDKSRKRNGRYKIFD